MDEKTTENEAITQPFEPEPLSEQTMVSHATVPLQVPDTPPPPPPIPQNYVPPGGDKSSWKWIVGSTLVVVLVLVAGAIGFTAGYGEGCPCDATRDARNNHATVSVLEGSVTAIGQTVNGQVLTIDAQREIIGENDLIARETIGAIEGTSQALSTALFVNATSRATQQSVATANVMTIQAAGTVIFERDMELTSVYGTNAALQATIEARPNPTSLPPSEGLQSETPPPPHDSTTPSPSTNSGSLRLLPNSTGTTYPFEPVLETAIFRDAWLHPGCGWQGIAGTVRFIEDSTETNLQIRVRRSGNVTSLFVITTGSATNYGEHGWEIGVAGQPENQDTYTVQLYDNDGATPLSPSVEVRFSGDCATNLLKLDFWQIGPLGVG